MSTYVCSLNSGILAQLLAMRSCRDLSLVVAVAASMAVHRRRCLVCDHRRSLPFDWEHGPYSSPPLPALQESALADAVALLVTQVWTPPMELWALTGIGALTI